jgi:hypothetical protein
MKKLLLFVFGLMICLGFSCKKGESLRKVYLLKQQIIDDSADGLPIDTTNYFYDDQNHLIRLNEGLTESKIYFTMSYDALGRINIARKFSSNGSMVKEYDFFYAPSVGYVFHNSAGVTDTVNFTFDSNNRVAEIATSHGGYETYTYDDRGNITSLKNYKADGSIDLYDEAFYTYDSKNNFFSQIPPNNYFLMYELNPDASTMVNNVSTKNADTYTYTYNTDGFPVSAIANVVGRKPATIYYNYTVK